MYNCTSATLAMRAKCSLSHHYLCLPNDQPHCFRRPCCHFPCKDFFPVSPRILSGYLLSQSFMVPSAAIILAGRLRVRFFSRSPDSGLMDLLDEPEERFHRSEDVCRKSRRREVEIKSAIGRRRSLKKEEKELLRESEHNGIGRRRRTLAGESKVCFSNSDNGTEFDASVVGEGEVREVHKYVDDSWRRRRHSLKTDVVLDSTKGDSLKENDTLRRLRVEDEHENNDKRTNLAQQVNSWENVSNRRSHKLTRISEVQSDSVGRSPASATVRRTEKGESSVSAVRQNSDVDHRVRAVKHDEHGISQDKQSKLVGFNYTDVRNSAYPVRNFHENSIKGREEQTIFEQRSSQVARDKRLHPDLRVEQNEITRSSQRLSEVSAFHGSDFGKALCINDRRVLGMDARTNLVLDSGQVFPEKMNQVALKRHKSEEREENFAMEGNSIQLRIDEETQFDRRVLEREEARRIREIHSEVSEIYNTNLEASSLFSGSRITRLESKPDSVHILIPAKKDKATQVEMNAVYYDQIEDSRFNATGSRRPSDSGVDLKEYDARFNLNQVSSLQEQYSQANKQAYIQANEFDVTRSNNRTVSSLQEDYNTRLENKTETFSAKNLVILSRKEEMPRSSQPRYSELNEHAGRSDILQNQHHTNDSAAKSYKLSASLVGESVDLLQKKIVDLNKSGKMPHDSSGIQIQPDRSDMQTTLIVDNRKQIFSTELNQEGNERKRTLLLGESSQSKPMLMASASLGGVRSSLQTHVELDYDVDKDDIHHITDNAIESARQFDKYSAFHVEEFVDKMQQEIMSQSKLGMDPNVSPGVQTEEIVHGESQVTAAMHVGELNERRKVGDTRFLNEGGRLSLSELGTKGPSDETWDVQGLSSQGTSKVKEPEEESPNFGAIVSTTPTPMRETRITRRSPKSLWSYVTDIIRMSWVLRGHSHSSTLQSDTRASSNESITSEVWFSGRDPDEVLSGDESRNEEKISLRKESAPVKESDELFFEKSKNEDELPAKKPNLSISSGIIKEGLSTITTSSSVGEQLVSKADAALPSTTGIVESRVRDKVKVLKPSSSYPVTMMKAGFSSSITQPTDVEKIEAAQVREGNISGLENFEPPLISNVDSDLSGFTATEVHISGIGPPKMKLDPSREKLPEIGGIMESGMKQRKFQRNKQVLREQFDEWEEAFKLENEQKKIDEIFMKEAISEARKGADTWEVPVGAVLVQNGKIIARSCNLVEELRDSTAHAEMICIRQASNLLHTWRLVETTLYVTLEPCPMCAGAILQARIDTVVWGAPNRLLGADGSWVRLFPGGDGGSNSMDPPSQMVGPVHPFHPKIKIRRGVLATECGDVMQQFFKLRRKKDPKQEPSPPPPPPCLPLSNRPTKLFAKLHNIFCMMFCL